MKAKRTVGLLILVCLCCVATGAMALTYTWTGATSTSWDLPRNWRVIGPSGPESYPQTTNDDAIFPMGGNRDCDLIDEEIDDLTINSNVDFVDARGTDPVLYVDTVTIAGATIATINDGAEITTKAAP